MRSAVAVALFVLVPVQLLLINLTGQWMPYIDTPEPQQWNIQYAPIVVLSFGAALFGFLAWKRWRPFKPLMAAVIWNAALCGLGLVAVVTLWGEKV